VTGPLHRRRRQALLRKGPPWVCHLCGGLIWKPHDMQLDHVVAIAAGGAHDGEVRPSHASCNARRGSRPL
jgi:5-methylcytosine-specific restriction endonuclease McrA